MKLISLIADRLNNLDVDCIIDNGSLEITFDDISTKIKMDDDWDETYQRYQLARVKTFNSETRCLCFNKLVEMQVRKLSLDYFYDSQYTYKDSSGNEVTISSKCSAIYSLAHFESDLYPAYFDRLIKKRLARSNGKSINISHLMTTPFTATYISKSRKRPADIIEIALLKIKSCLFKLAVEQRECIEIWKQRELLNLPHCTEDSVEDFTMPKAVYNDTVVSYYKVARSSQFASQSFLDYFHVLEYHFLRVTEDKLHYQIRTMVNQTNFKANEDGLDKLIAMVRKQDAKSDETEMLRSVIEKFVPEDDFISYLKSVEHECGQKIYSKKRKIFGELLEIPLTEGHAISNAARALKHIRNAIVHSSDRYKREDCHIPLSESENIIAEFIPIIRYFAEKVIYGTAT